MKYLLSHLIHCDAFHWITTVLDFLRRKAAAIFGTNQPVKRQRKPFCIHHHFARYFCWLGRGFCSAYFLDAFYRLSLSVKLWTNLIHTASSSVSFVSYSHTHFHPHLLLTKGCCYVSPLQPPSSKSITHKVNRKRNRKVMECADWLTPIKRRATECRQFLWS